MKEESKYYTPTLEEFHVGFEYEVQQLEELYGSITYTEEYARFNYEFGDDINLERVRVKYLDKDDIESLGFILKREFNCFMKINMYSVDCFIYLNPWYTQIKVGRDITKTEQVFEGRIKNKSELQQILKMVL